MANNICEFKVELGETDSAGLVYYPNYFRWFDRATRSFLRITGLTPREMLGKFHFEQPVIACDCKFYAPLRYDDPVRIETVVSEVENMTFRLEHNVYSEGNLVASGYEVRAWVEIDNPFEEGKLNSVDIPRFFAEILKESLPKTLCEDAVLVMD
jgi:acyl-CoA thioester hydrolase